MKGEDLSFATKLSLAQRHAEAAQLNMDTLNELMREMVGGFDRMNRIIAADELRDEIRAQMSNGHANGGGANGVTITAEHLPNGGNQTGRQKPHVISEEGRKRMREGAAKARDARLKQLAEAKGLIEAPKATPPTPPALTPIDNNSTKQFGHWPYPFLIGKYVKENPTGQFDAIDIIKMTNKMGYDINLKSLRGALTHQCALGVITNIAVGPNGIPGSGGTPGIYLPGPAPKSITKATTSKSVSVSVHGKKLGRPVGRKDSQRRVRRSA